MKKIVLIPIDERPCTYDYPAMMDFIDKVNRLGFYFNNVNEVEINNVKVEKQRGEKFIFENIHEIKGDI